MIAQHCGFQRAQLKTLFQMGFEEGFKLLIGRLSGQGSGCELQYDYGATGK
jgi:hypothetical protein